MFHTAEDGFCEDVFSCLECIQVLVCLLHESVVESGQAVLFQLNWFLLNCLTDLEPVKKELAPLALKPVRLWRNGSAFHFFKVQIGFK